MEEEIKKSFLESKFQFNDSKLNAAINIAINAYSDKKQGEKSYIIHAMDVAKEAIKLKLDEDSVYASYLHELMDVNYDMKIVEEKLGKDVVNIIKGVDKLTYLNYSSGYKLNEDILRKMFMAIAKDIRVVIVKLLDRLCTMRNANILDEDFRKIKAKETLEIYAPIAHRLGISNVKSELEDISFRILYPEEYQDIKKKIDAKKSEREAFIHSRINEIKQRLDDEHIVCEVYGRPKHFYSIYRKMVDKGYEIEDIFDLLAIRIIVDSIKDCYTALGIVHEMYKPIPGRFKDYIAVPKTNNYQSLHTTVFGENSNAFEVQIRTWDMQSHAEYGIAAHFMYKEKNKSKHIDVAEQKIMWIRQTLELERELTENSECFNKFSKLELFGEEVFVFTPKGEIKALPKGATVIDFAYSIHQNVAEKMTGAKVNGKMVPISTVLNNTDLVQIITSASSKGPNLDWLKFATSQSSKNKITAYIKKKNSKENILRGKEELEKELKKHKIPKDELLSEKRVLRVCKELNCKNLEHIYENIGFGALNYLKVANRFIQVYNEENGNSIKLQEKKVDAKSLKRNFDVIEVEGLNNCLVKLARCCKPIYGDEICGYITYSNGVSVHRSNCPNLKSLDLINRKINVKWKSRPNSSFDTGIKVFSNYRENVTVEIIQKLQEMKVEMTSIKADKTDRQEMIITVNINTKDNESLNKVLRELKKIDSVYEVKRAR